jgi:hypothetical protein
MVGGGLDVVVAAGAGLDQRKGDAVVAEVPLVEEVAPDRDVEDLLPQHGPGDGVGLVEVVVVTVAPPADLGDPHRVRSDQALEVLDLTGDAVLLPGVVVARVGVDCDDVEIGEAAGGDELLPPPERHAERGAADDRRGRIGRFDPGVEGLQHL